MNKEVLLNEIQYKAVRSSGPGGQNVNKVSSKVILSFDVTNSNGISDEERTLLLDKLASKISQEGILQLSSDEDRSQLKNKEIVTKRFLELLTKSLKKPKVRKETKIPKAIKEKRLQEKKKSSEIKGNRKKPKF